MAEAQAQHAEASTRYTAARQAWQEAKARGDAQAERAARDAINRAVLDANDASERFQAAQFRVRIAASTPTTPASESVAEQPRQRESQARTAEGRVVQPRTIGEAAPRRVGGNTPGTQGSTPQTAPRTLGPSAPRAEHGKVGPRPHLPGDVPGGAARATQRKAEREAEYAARYQISVHRQALARVGARLAATTNPLQRAVLLREVREHEDGIARHEARLRDLGVTP